MTTGEHNEGQMTHRHSAPEKQHAEHQMQGKHQHESHHAMMVADFRRRFWVSLGITVPVLLLSPLIQELLGIADVIVFPGDAYVLCVLSSAVFFYGGYPFLKGIFNELKSKSPGRSANSRGNPFIKNLANPD